MDLVYSALLLHSAGKEINEESVEKVMKAAGAEADKAMVKALVASLKDVNIEEAIKTAAMPVAAAAPAAAEEKKEEKKEEDEGKKAEEAAAGLSSLFG